MSTPWEIAKELLKEDIASGYVPRTMKPAVVADLRIEYQRVKYTNFRNNLNRLRQTLGTQSDAATFDDAAVAHDRLIHPIRMNNPPRWNGSEAEGLLKRDVDEGKHLRMMPRQLRQTNDAYKVFNLDVFRNHIHQEVRTRKETPYWLAKKAAIKRKKERKKKAAAGIDVGALDAADGFDEADLVLE
jgi:hypothetical protein